MKIVENEKGKEKLLKERSGTTFLDLEKFAIFRDFFANFSSCFSHVFQVFFCRFFGVFLKKNRFFFSKKTPPLTHQKCMQQKEKKGEKGGLRAVYFFLGASRR